MVAGDDHVIADLITDGPIPEIHISDKDGEFSGQLFPAFLLNIPS